MQKYNLFINNNFKSLQFNDLIDDSIYSLMKNNLYDYSVIIILENKPNNNNEYITLNINDNINCYLFPLSNSNYIFNKGDILYTHQNDAIFVIESYIGENKFNIKLINIDNYKLYNNTISLLYNKNLELFMYNNNNLNNSIKSSKIPIGKFFSNDDVEFVKYILSKIVITNDSTNIIVTTNFNIETDTDKLVYFNVINKFYLNLYLYDYNSFKYIYMMDINNDNMKENHYIDNNNSYYINGILKSFHTKIIPHYSQKLTQNNTYIYNTDIINKFTKYNKTYNDEKLILLIQLSLNDKNDIYDRLNNIESDYIYLIY